MEDLKALRAKASDIRSRILLFIEFLALCPREEQREAANFLEWEIDRLLGLVEKIEKVGRGLEARDARAAELRRVEQKVFGPQVDA
jgi:hypothetical protein